MKRIRIINARIRSGEDIFWAVCDTCGWEGLSHWTYLPDTAIKDGKRHRCSRPNLLRGARLHTIVHHGA